MLSEVDNIVATIEDKVDNSILAAIANLVSPRVDLAIRLANALSGRDPGIVLYDPDQRVFSGNTEEIPHMTTADRLNSNTETNRIDETRDNTRVEACDSPAFENNFDRRTHTHYSAISCRIVF